MVNQWLQVGLNMGKARLTIVNAWLTMDKVRLRMGKLCLTMVKVRG